MIVDLPNASTSKISQRLIEIREDVGAMALSDLKEIEPQKEKIERNTRQFVEGRPANNVLLTGARGTGKSSLIKACLNAYAPQGLRLIEERLVVGEALGVVPTPLASAAPAWPATVPATAARARRRWCPSTGAHRRRRRRSEAAAHPVCHGACAAGCRFDRPHEPRGESAAPELATGSVVPQVVGRVGGVQADVGAICVSGSWRRRRHFPWYGCQPVDLQHRIHGPCE